MGLGQGLEEQSPQKYLVLGHPRYSGMVDLGI